MPISDPFKKSGFALALGRLITNMAIFAFTRCDINRMLRTVTTNRTNTESDIMVFWEITVYFKWMNEGSGTRPSLRIVSEKSHL